MPINQPREAISVRHNHTTTPQRTRINATQLPAEIIEQCLFSMDAYERTPAFLLKLQSQGSVLKRVTQSEILWQLFAPKAASRRNQTRHAAFMERLGERSAGGNWFLYKLYKDAKSDNIDLFKCDELALNGSTATDPDLASAFAFASDSAEYCGHDVRNDPHIMNALLGRLRPRFISTFPLQDRDLVQSLTFIPTKFWSRREVEFIVINDHIVPHQMVPKHWWADAQVQRVAAPCAYAWRHFAVHIDKDPLQAEALFDIFLASERHTERSQWMPSPSDVADVWTYCPPTLRSNSARLAQLLVKPTRIGKIDVRLGLSIDTKEQLAHLITIRPQIYRDLVQDTERSGRLALRYGSDVDLFRLALCYAQNDKNLQTSIYNAASVVLRADTERSGAPSGHHSAARALTRYFFRPNA